MLCLAGSASAAHAAGGALPPDTPLIHDRKEHHVCPQRPAHSRHLCPHLESENASAPFRNEKSGRGKLPLIAGFLVGLIGVVFIVGGAVGWFTVKSELADEQITVAEDAENFAGEKADGPFSAYSQAETVKKHVLESTGGKTYAELEQDDPVRDMALQGSTVRSALMTSVISFGVSALAFGTGVAFVITGVGLGARRKS